jgi:DNA-binding XRE family transcriptional regulator
VAEPSPQTDRGRERDVSGLSVFHCKGITFDDNAYREAGWAMDLAELVYTTRTKAGLTQTELAAAMGTSQSAVAAWENGARTPGVETLERLARACGWQAIPPRQRPPAPTVTPSSSRT